ncbi:peroxisomal membrane protein pex14 [Coemansia thaxteri]|uniref:Peroxisomal membrane protein PEX14 n=1 Tax=Coemansia thaxteri TaxID=2663907 RepID=A0A9W8BJM0_9FUNG|nr:peroxisomal membrane protein pex14 [Coemansia thaxteri]KAJ2008928.1 peroxisomal membrane protein pex14 [Coemansia thaxteri]KAJ2473550.1 peroxisomal membrane protein pex14 [Coemansia sp. RSA 2322]KAJ2485831.1 peroxisomal membrane protein pex14 [Coemansia sp. RSA 2320]
MSAEAQPSLAISPHVLREDIIESAVRFLVDPKVQTSTLAKKVSFLETKGLSNAEIEDALARAKRQHDSPTEQHSNGTAAGSDGPAPAYGYARPLAPPVAPPRPHLDWKDYFIAAVVAGGLGYGLYMLVKKYIRPMLLAQDSNKRLEEEKQLLLEQNEFTRKQLQTLSESTTRILDTIAQQSQKTSEAIEGMASVMEKISEQELEHNSAARRLMITLEDLQREISGLSSKMAKSGTTSVADVQSDIRSLRSLLLSRRVPAYGASPAARPSTPSVTNAVVEGSSDSGLHISPAPTIEGDEAGGEVESLSAADGSLSAASMPTPTIPAWQLGPSGNEDKGKQAAE